MQIESEQLVIHKDNEVIIHFATAYVPSDPQDI